jgi:SpoVK/Ycf46/Vps4 family AAA+-type ATPase
MLNLVLLFHTMAASKKSPHLFRNIKCYESTEWLANNKKKYRSVFEQTLCSYIYCEFSFFNLKFKEKDWFLKLHLKCFDNENNLICDLNCDRNVSLNSNVVYVREGWGTKTPGGFWKKGTYRWEAWLDEEVVAEKYFYVYDFGITREQGNPYLDIESIKLYEGPDANIQENERKYMRVFNYEETRYVWLELRGLNKIPEPDHWACELTFNFRTANNMLKGSIIKMFFVYPEQTEVLVTVGWGADKIGTWAHDNYYVDVLFMDTLIASVDFQMGNDFIPAENKDFLNFNPIKIPIGVPEKKEASTSVAKASGRKHTEHDIDSMLKELDALIGLEEVKTRIREYASYLNFITLRKDKGIEEEEPINLHAVFMGNPGTGKTTVARKLGKIYKQLGLLSKGHVHEVDRTDLVAEFIGQTAPKTKAAIKKAKGGILFIDEAYALARKDDDAKDFGKEAVEILLKELSDGEDIAIIAAGYPTEIQNFLESNPGLKSRFNMSIDFPDYQPDELIRIADFAASRRGVKLSEQAREDLYKKLVDVYRSRDRFFGNARLVNSLIDECKLNLGLRVMGEEHPENLSMEELSTIETEDVEQLSLSRERPAPDLPIDEDLLRESLDKLNRMIGLEGVKNEIQDLIKLVRFYKETGKDVNQSFSLHSVFTGNPGTGKTTVARILAQIYKSLGIIERGHIIECDRQSLIGGYIGQTAIKTGELIEKAMGGVLFIDEAYALTEGGGTDYGKEAIEIILKRMEDYRGHFIVIAAGYTNNMRRFLESNPGLKSRFDRVFHFEDFEPAELHEIAINQLRESQLKPDKKASAKLLEMLQTMFESRDQYFGNGRSVRRITEEIVRKQHLRMSGMSADERSIELIHEVRLSDLEGIEVKKVAKDYSNPIGFRMSN